MTVVTVMMSGMEVPTQDYVRKSLNLAMNAWQDQDGMVIMIAMYNVLIIIII